MKNSRHPSLVLLAPIFFVALLISFIIPPVEKTSTVEEANSSSVFSMVRDDTFKAYLSYTPGTKPDVIQEGFADFFNRTSTVKAQGFPFVFKLEIVPSAGFTTPHYSWSIIALIINGIIWTIPLYVLLWVFMGMRKKPAPAPEPTQSDSAPNS